MEFNQKKKLKEVSKRLGYSAMAFTLAGNFIVVGSSTPTAFAMQKDKVAKIDKKSNKKEKKDSKKESSKTSKKTVKKKDESKEDKNVDKKTGSKNEEESVTSEDKRDMVAAIKNMNHQEVLEKKAKQAQGKDSEGSIIYLDEDGNQIDPSTITTYGSTDTDKGTAQENTDKTKPSGWTYGGAVISKSAGTVSGPSGKETYYNLPMSGVVSIMRSMGFSESEYPYHVREDGVKMLGNYVMVAADLSLRPRGSLIMTSVGVGIVCDTGSFAYSNHTQLDIATNW